MKSLLAPTFALAAIAFLAGPAQAADISYQQQPQATVSSEWTGFMIRGRVIGVVPDRSKASLNIPGSAHVSSDLAPEIDFSYFFTPNIAVEVICCASNHSIKGRGALRGVDIGDTWVIPATVMAQYHFTNLGRFKPYVGVGLNYSIYFDEKGTGPTINRLDLKNSVGVAAQIGIDYMLDDHWGLNFDIKKIYMEPKVSLYAGDARVYGRAKINPWVIGAGVTYRF